MARLAEFISYLDDKRMIDASKIQEESEAGYENRTEFQRYAYLARRFGLDLGYEFPSNMCGPYSAAISRDILALDLSNITPCEAPSELDENKFLNAVSDRPDGWPLVATTILQETTHDPNTPRDEIYSWVTAHSPEFIDRVYDDLAKLKLY